MQTLFGERVRKAREVLGLSQQEFASKVGVSVTTIQNYEGGKLPKGEHAISLAKCLGCSIDWLLTGAGEAFDPSKISLDLARAGTLRAGDPLAKVVVASDQQEDNPVIIECDTSEIVMVPMVEARLSAGSGSFETGGDLGRHYAFRLDFLRRKGIPSKMVLMRVAGDSMDPEIKDGDVVLIDQNQATPIPGKLYAVGVEDMVYIKEVNAEPGKLVLSSYNKAYPALEVDARGDLKDGIRIIGRAVWVGRELK
ncbi:HTH-type transcriptional regulator PrtR [Fundidesulfovibrio magnetotacticus]|uniref:HTH-type transcriptional regulator PrtR n=1 Tax=Fundidesulfovibrio magnetotacticus TaxID=2730080 RepID=A0A6V8LRU8_9BACT|nr:helix-turn-helix transcriptional regulator [Fundidesulfovibrio magnetotacticus]GFK94454.1 HTH-type transcriptional regulator PrtR [Fundidesulfovibrio magnetotacticus]